MCSKSSFQTNILVITLVLISCVHWGDAAKKGHPSHGDGNDKRTPQAAVCDQVFGSTSFPRHHGQNPSPSDAEAEDKGIFVAKNRAPLNVSSSQAHKCDIPSAPQAMRSKRSSRRIHHKCIHGSSKVQRRLHDGMDHSVPLRGTSDQRHFNAEQQGTPTSPQVFPKPIRIVASFRDLTAQGKSCDVVNATRPDFGGGTVTCREVDILTQAKRDIIQNQLLPAAIDRLSRLIRVAPTPSNIFLPSVQFCSPFTIPISHVRDGVDADYVVYVSSVPAGESVLAWATPCGIAASGKPVVGVVNFAPEYVMWSPLTPDLNEEQVDTAVHELMHALGFSPSFFPRVITERRRGKSVSVIGSATVRAVARAYFNCSTTSGAEIEDGGSSGSAGAHWESRILSDEIMAPAAGGLFSVFTLALLRDMGFYYVDLELGEPMTWAKNGGCGFLNSKCNTDAAGMYKYFCWDSSQQICTKQSSKIGFCPIYDHGAPLPSAFQYFTDPQLGGFFEFPDYCPIPYDRDGSCYSDPVDPETGAILSLPTSQLLNGFYVGQGGKCFQVDGVVLLNSTKNLTELTARCFQARCVQTQTGLRIEFKIGSGTIQSDWIQCPADGSAGKVAAPSSSGWNGTVYCPTPDNFCGDVTEGATTAVPRTWSPGTAIPGTPVPPSPAPPTPVPFALDSPVASGKGDIGAISLKLSGTAAEWTQLLSGPGTNSPTTNSTSPAATPAPPSMAAAVRNAIRADLATVLKVSVAQLRVDSTRVGSLLVNLTLLVPDSNTSNSLTDTQISTMAADSEKRLSAVVGKGSWLQSTSVVYSTVSTDNLKLTQATFVESPRSSSESIRVGLSVATLMFWVVGVILTYA
jgi:leishmanolysin